MFLMRGSLHEIEIGQARAGQIETHKRKLDAQKSVQKEGSILASTALNRSKKKRRDAAEAELKKAQKAILTVENKAKESYMKRVFRHEKDEKSRRLLVQESQVLGCFYSSGYLDYYSRP
jgi:hypothetical protein